MILIEKRAHLVLETPFDVVRLLRVDVVDQRADIRRADGKQTVSTLPRELGYPLLFHPYRRSGFHLGYEFRCRSRRRQSDRKMNVVGNSTHSKALTIQFARGSGEIRMKIRNHVIVDERSPMFRAENDMHQIEAQRLRHGSDYMSGLQPSAVLADTYLGLRPRLVCRRAFGPQRLSIQLAGNQLSIQQAGNQPRTQQTTNPGERPCNQAVRTRLETNPWQILSAKGATTYQPGPKAQVDNHQTPRGLKARHNVSVNTVSSASHEATTS
jgi:hypothetical protein